MEMYKSLSFRHIFNHLLPFLFFSHVKRPRAKENANGEADGSHLFFLTRTTLTQITPKRPLSPQISRKFHHRSLLWHSPRQFSTISRQIDTVIWVKKSLKNCFAHQNGVFSLRLHHRRLTSLTHMQLVPIFVQCHVYIHYVFIFFISRTSPCQIYFHLLHTSLQYYSTANFILFAYNNFKKNIGFLFFEKMWNCELFFLPDFYLVFSFWKIYLIIAYSEFWIRKLDFYTFKGPSYT